MPITKNRESRHVAVLDNPLKRSQYSRAAGQAGFEYWVRVRNGVHLNAHHLNQIKLNFKLHVVKIT